MTGRLTFLATTFASVMMLLVMTISCTGQPREFEITVSAGGFDRSESVVSFHFPDTVGQGTYRMESESGASAYVQVDEDNRGTFILKNLAAGESRSYSMTAKPVEAEPEVSMSIHENTMTYKSGKKKILTYYHKQNKLPEGMDEVYKRGGYIHPVYSPDGRVITNHLNPDGHTHHYGIWSSWTKTEFEGRTPDFWNVHNGTGRVNHKDSVESGWEGPVHAGFKAINYFVDLSSEKPAIALNEEWEVMVYHPVKEGKYFMFDLKVTQSANTAQPLILPQYHYGGVGFRAHANWTNPDSINFLTSEGLGREANETRPHWVHAGGYTNGRLSGITMMDHPRNFRHPQPVRIHPDDPYFVYAPQQLGEFSIMPGSPYVARYRFVTYDGNPEPEELDRIWNDYAYPPGVTVKTK